MPYSLFFVDRIMHFLYTSEAVNKFVIKLHCIIELLNLKKMYAFTSKKDEFKLAE